MWMITAALVLYGLTLVGVSCFLLGRATSPQRREKDPPEMMLSEQERKTLRELQNFLQYDGFSQP